MQLPFDFDRAIEGLSKVTLRGGVVGKVTFAVVAVSIALTVISSTASNIWISAASMFMIFILAFVMLWRVVSFADRNPQAALLEGAEFLVHQQIVHATKDIPNLPLPQQQQTQPEPVEGMDADPYLAQVPDQIVSELPNSGENK